MKCRILRASGAAALAALWIAPGAPSLAGDRADAERLIEGAGAKQHVRFLADDKLEGRAAGTAGNRMAGEYIAVLLERYGLEPGGDAPADGGGKRSWYQRFETDGVSCRNVVAVRRGREDGAGAGAEGGGKDHIVLGAHYDHVGHGEAGGIPTLSGPQGAVHNGADDNASGSAALLEIAEAVASLDRAPRRTVVLVWFDGEEHGLWGSRRYVEAPRFPLERCAAMINLDMVGRARGGRVQVIGAASAPGLDAAIAEENRGIGLVLDCDPFMVPNSDHFSFYGRRVPTAFFCTGLHGDYHRPGDDWEKVNEADLARVARLTFRAAMRVAEDGLTPEFVEVPDVPFIAMGLEMLQGVTGSDAFEKIARAAYGGIEGLFVEPRGAGDPGRDAPAGLHVRYVEPGSGAERAGFRAGDRIVKADGKRTQGALGQWRLRLLARARPSLEVVVARGGEERTLTLERTAPGPRVEAPEERRAEERRPPPGKRERREF